MEVELSAAIMDTGIGLTTEQSANLFGAFVQADATVTRKFGGTGLGLLISKRLAQLLGGDISIDSEFGVGSTFTATFAVGMLDSAATSSGTQDEIRLAVQPPNQDIKGAVSPIPYVTPLPLANLKILFAEDGPDNQRLIAHILRKAGAEVQIAENGKLAIEMLTIDGMLDSPLRIPNPFDLLLSDMQMPVMDGYATARWLRARGSTIPIVALTAHAMSSDLDLSGRQRSTCRLSSAKRVRVLWIYGSCRFVRVNSAKLTNARSRRTMLSTRFRIVGHDIVEAGLFSRFNKVHGLGQCRFCTRNRYYPVASRPLVD